MPLLKKRTNKEITEIYLRNIDSVYRTAFAFLKNKANTEDAVQTTFIKLINSSPKFKNKDHEKAWLIFTCSNTCKDMLRRKYNTEEPLIDEAASTENVDSLLDEVLALPVKLRTAIYLHYYEGYTSEEIGKIQNLSSSTVRNQLHDEREILKKRLGGNFFE